MLIVGYVCILLVLEGEGFRNRFDSRSFEKRGNEKSEKYDGNFVFGCD